jgi:hypothetical protein
MDIPRFIEKLPNRVIIGNFIDYLIAKMLHVNFQNKVIKFDLNIVHKENFPQKIYLEYIDMMTDWRNLLEDIFQISIFNIKDDGNIFNDLKNILINSESYKHYSNISDKLTKYINTFKPKEIFSHLNVSHANIRGEIDLLVDETLFEIKTNQYEIATTSNISQTLIYGYLMQKKDKNVKNIILYNPISGEITKLNTSNINFKEVASIFYGHFKKSNN